VHSDTTRALDSGNPRPLWRLNGSLLREEASPHQGGWRPFRARSSGDFYCLVFLTQTCSTTLPSPTHNILPLNGPFNSTILTAFAQLPSLPITPPYLPSTASPHISTAPRNLSCATTHIDPSSAEQARANAAPLKSFVHEVLCRSRTSCSVLQTALWLIEAFRSKVPDLIHQEQTEGIRGEVDQGSRVLPPDYLRLCSSYMIHRKSSSDHQR